MIGKTAPRRIFAALLFAAFAAALPAHAQSPEQEKMFDGNWRFSLTPYLWLPNINSTIRFDGPFNRTVDAKTEPSSYLSNLEFAFMITGEARKGEWSIFTDYMYMRFNVDNSKVRAIRDPGTPGIVPLNTSSSMDLSSNVWTLAGAYTAARGASGHLDVFAGFRYLNADSTLDYSAVGLSGGLLGGSASATFNQWSGIVGVKGQIRFGDSRWFVPYYVDVGGGSGASTWQALVGVGYGFGWGNVTLTIRNLSYNFNDDRADMRFTGPALGATFLF